MKLISKRKDYYDYFAKNPMISEDSWHRVWRRTPTIVPVNFQTPHTGLRHFHHVMPFKYHFSAFTIFFCGKEFPCLKLSVDDKDSYFYNAKDFIDALEFSLKDELIKDINEFFDVKNRRWIKKDYSHASLPRLKNDEMHRVLGTPVFVVYDNDFSIEYQETRFNENHINVLINPILSDFEFRKAVDAFDCYQRLEFYFANELVQPDVINFKVPDKINAESHGFDKFSFRKESSSKRK